MTARGAEPTPLQLALAGMLSLVVAMGIGRFVYTPILPDMVTGLGMGPSEAGAVASANYLGYLVGALLLSARGTFLPPRQLLLGSLLASVVTTGLMAYAPQAFLLPWQIAIRFVSGVAAAFVLVIASSIVLDRLREQGRSGLTAVHFAGVGVGIAISAVLVVTVSALGWNWPFEWLVCAVVSLLLFPVILRFLPARDQAHRKDAGYPPLRYRPAFIALFFSYSLFGFGYVITATFIVAIVRDTPEIAALEPLVWVAVGLAVIPSGWIAQAIAARFGLFAALALANSLLGLGVLASVAWVSAAGILFAAICLGMSITSIASMSLAAARILTPADPRQIFGVMTVGFGAGQVIGPILAGAIAEVTGDFVLASFIAAAAQGLAAILALGSDRMHRAGLSDC